MVKEDPFIPIAWQKDHKGMQGNTYITGKKEVNYCIDTWFWAKEKALRSAKDLNNKIAYPNGDFDRSYDEVDVTKQLCNRLLEPFMWHTVLVTATEWDNWFELRCPKYYLKESKEYYKSKKDWVDAYNSNPLGSEIWEGFSLDVNSSIWKDINSSQAEIHIQALAEAMWDAMNENTPKQLESGQWHLPFGDKMDFSKFDFPDYPGSSKMIKLWNEAKVKIAVARAARLSYMTFEGEINYEKDIQLHDQLLKSHHMSPFEHAARCMTEEEYFTFTKGKATNLEDGLQYFPESANGWCNNFRGWIQYRYLIENSYE
jgi:hypothetical protein